MESKGPRGFESRGLKTSGGFKESSGATLPDVFVKLKGCKIGRRWMASCIYKFRFGMYIYIYINKFMYWLQNIIYRYLLGSP